MRVILVATLALAVCLALLAGQRADLVADLAPPIMG